MATSYNAMPGYKMWLSDSSTLMSTRAHDPYLIAIDNLVKALEEAGPDGNVRYLLLVDLFWSLDYWLKVYKSMPKMDAKRMPVIYELYKWCAGALCLIFGCQVNTLVNKLEFAFGRTVGEHGLKVDLELGWMKLLSDAERRLRKLHFEGGVAYQHQWWSTASNLTTKVLAESKHACDTSAFFGTGADKTDFGGFVMTMGRDFYMARHGGPNEKEKRVFHSSYFGDLPVACAGTMLIRGGQILTVCPDSGHFQPGDVNVMMMLRALRMLQVDLRKVVVQDFKGNNIGSAATIVNKNLWAEVVVHMKKNMETMKGNQKELRHLRGEFKSPSTTVVDYGYVTGETPSEISMYQRGSRSSLTVNYSDPNVVDVPYNNSAPVVNYF